METKTKLNKLRKMAADAKAKNEIALTTVFGLLNEKMSDNIADENFDLLLSVFMNERAQYATTLLKKKQSTLAEQEIFCLSLLSLTFLGGRKRPFIEGNKIKVKND